MVVMIVMIVNGDNDDCEYYGDDCYDGNDRDRDDASKFSLSIDAGGREADILAAGTTPLNSDPIVFTTIAIARGSIITITIARGTIITTAGI